MPATAYACQVDGEPTQVTVAPDALRLGDRSLGYLDMDEVVLEGQAVHLGMVGGTAVTLTHLARTRDAFLHEFLPARATCRRAALLQWTGDRPLDRYDAREGDEEVQVHLFPDGLTVERLAAPPTLVPFSLVLAVHRAGYELTVELRASPAVTIGRLGKRTDEFLADVERARTDLAARTADAYRALSADLAGFAAPDGWAVTATEAGPHWPALRAAVAGHARAHEVDVLERLAGTALRLGVKAGPGDEVMPFALAPVGPRVAVEATDTEARATYVFQVDDPDRLNVALLLTSFRREALHLPQDRLGRWAVAVRTLEVVRWARQAFRARVVHDGSWEDRISSALALSERPAASSVPTHD